MAAMSDAERFACWAQIMRNEAAPGGGAITKPDLRAAVNAADDWVDAQTTLYNAVLPNPFKSLATAEEKAMLLMYVVARRFGREL